MNDSGKFPRPPPITGMNGLLNMTMNNPKQAHYTIDSTHINEMFTSEQTKLTGRARHTSLMMSLSGLNNPAGPKYVDGVHGRHHPQKPVVPPGGKPMMTSGVDNSY